MTLLELCNKTLWPPNRLEDVNSKALNRLKEILECTNPSKFVFIAYDGVPPLAKLQHVRKIWFINSKDREKAIISLKQRRQQKETHNTNNQDTDSSTLDGLLFDRNNIAPGTEFMRINCENVLRYMEEWKVCNSSAKSNQKVDFYCSTSLEPGEGENKIINFIRNKDFTKISAEGDRLIIYSADQDLVMLSAMLDLPLLYIELLKKLEVENVDSCDAELVNINALRRALLDLLIPNSRNSDKFNNRKKV
ncbi:MAG: 5'-3' exoribonuclease 1, variant 2 [Marteilia pararefringens]